MRALVAAALVLAACRGGPTTPPEDAAPVPVPVPVPAPVPAPASAPASASAFPFGPATDIPKYACPLLVPGGPFRSFLSPADTRVAYVDGDDLLALVNRSPTGALPPSYVPSDLVDLHDLSPRSAQQCESAHACLRHDAAVALHHLIDAMRLEGMEGRVESAFRAFGTQCWVLGGWASKARAGFCEATTQSALPGHSQHQLGTTVDMFTNEWAYKGDVFRDGFGCTRGGKWLDDNAWHHGFVVSYPIDPDDRKDGSRCAARWDHSVPIDPKTGYKHEPWHLRYVGVDAAQRFHDAWLASEPGSPQEITLEQWLRAERGLVGDAELPVCDGCECGACSTLAQDGDKAPCGDASLRLEPSGRVASPAEEPTLTDAAVKTDGTGLLVEASVHAPAHTPTQPPVTDATGPTYVDGATFEALVPYVDTKPHRYPDLPGAWRVAIEPLPPATVRWPWRASLARAELAVTWNRANLVLPAKPGDGAVKVRLVAPAGTEKLRVTLLRDGVEHGTREISVP